MKKFFNKALFYEHVNREKEYVIPIIMMILVMNIELIFTIIADLFPNSNVEADRAVAIVAGDNFVYIAVIVAIVYSIIFFVTKKQKKLTFLNSIGVTRNEILGTRLISIATTIGITTVSTLIIRFIFGFMYLESITTVIGMTKGEVFLTLINNSIDCIVLSLLIAIIFALSQLLFGSALWSFILISFGFAPTLFLPRAISEFISPKLGFLKELMERVSVFILDHSSFDNNFNSVDFQGRLMSSTKDFLIGVVILAVIFYLNNKYEAENLSDIFLFKFVRIIVTAIIAIYLAIAVSLCLYLIVGLYHYFNGSDFTSYIMERYNLQSNDAKIGEYLNDYLVKLQLIANIIAVVILPFVYKLTNFIFNIFEGKSKKRKAKKILKAAD